MEHSSLSFHEIETRLCEEIDAIHENELEPYSLCVNETWNPDEPERLIESLEHYTALIFLRRLMRNNIMTFAEQSNTPLATVSTTGSPSVIDMKQDIYQNSDGEIVCTDEMSQQAQLTLLLILQATASALFDIVTYCRTVCRSQISLEEMEEDVRSQQEHIVEKINVCLRYVHSQSQIEESDARNALMAGERDDEVLSAVIDRLKPQNILVEARRIVVNKFGIPWKKKH